jgi:hypothetical protein
MVIEAEVEANQDVIEDIIPEDFVPVNPEPTNVVADDHLPEDFMKECMDLINDMGPTPEPEKKPEPAKPTKSLEFDINVILAAMPDTFTPSVLDKAFKLNDGGKTVRRHLRKNFAETLAHAHNDKWGFDKKANVKILEYFAARYPFDANAIKAK